MRIAGTAARLGDDVNTDIHCSNKYFPGRDDAYVARHAFEKLDPGLAGGFAPGGIIVAGANFGINSSREQAVHVMRLMGVSAIAARSFGRQFYRNCINNGLPVVECDTGGIAGGDLVEIDLAAGRVVVAARGIALDVPRLPPAVQALLAAGGLIAYLKAHPDWGL